VDKYQVDNKFITARYLDQERAMKTVFLGASHSTKRGVEGLLDVVVERLKSCGLLDIAHKKLTGLTTDGEPANTGKTAGFWMKMREYFGRDMLLVHCTQIRSGDG
jgi:hypothetical protein